MSEEIIEGQAVELDNNGNAVQQRPSALAIRNDAALVVDIRRSLPAAQAQFQAIQDFVASTMVADEDFGSVPGIAKPFLFKSGAEKLATLFGYAPIYTTLEKVEDWGEKRINGFFFYRYRCDLVSKTTGVVMGSGIGSCNSMESKYRWRQGERLCPTCGKPAIIKGKEQYGGGWICFTKKGGCGAKFPDNAPEIVKQNVGRVENDDVFSQVNAIDKISQKRSLVAAVLIATGTSSLFTQDEDVVEAANDAPPPPTGTTAVPPQRQAPAASAAPSTTTVVSPKCPNCQGEMVIRGKRGKPEEKFWGCKKYPDCKGIVNVEDVPVEPQAAGHSEPVASTDKKAPPDPEVIKARSRLIDATMKLKGTEDRNIAKMEASKIATESFGNVVQMTVAELDMTTAYVSVLTYAKSLHENPEDYIKARLATEPFKLNPFKDKWTALSSDQLDMLLEEVRIAASEADKAQTAAGDFDEYPDPFAGA